MAKKQAHYRLDASLVEALEEKAKTESITITELVTRYLRQGLGLPVKNPETIDVEQLEQKILERVSSLIHKDTQINYDIEKRITEGVTERVTEALLKDIEEKINIIVEKCVANRVHVSVSKVNANPQQALNETLALKDDEAKKENLEPVDSWDKDLEELELSQKKLTKVRKTTSELVKILQEEQPTGNWSNQKLRSYTLGNSIDKTHTVGRCQFQYAEPRKRTEKDKSLFWFDVIHPLPKA